jgi:hypothetical protein
MVFEIPLLKSHSARKHVYVVADFSLQHNAAFVHRLCRTSNAGW